VASIDYKTRRARVRRADANESIRSSADQTLNIRSQTSEDRRQRSRLRAATARQADIDETICFLQSYHVISVTIDSLGESTPFVSRQLPPRSTVTSRRNRPCRSSHSLHSDNGQLFVKDCQADDFRGRDLRDSLFDLRQNLFHLLLAEGAHRRSFDVAQ
jgi:hypothetical protein